MAATTNRTSRTFVDYLNVPSENTTYKMGYSFETPDLSPLQYTPIRELKWGKGHTKKKIDVIKALSIDKYQIVNTTSPLLNNHIAYGLQCHWCNSFAFFIDFMPAFGTILSSEECYFADGSHPNEGDPVICPTCNNLLHVEPSMLKEIIFKEDYVNQ